MRALMHPRHTQAPAPPTTAAPIPQPAVALPPPILNDDTTEYDEEEYDEGAYGTEYDQQWQVRCRPRPRPSARHAR